ncbi:MAG TPA: hypothetical protein VFF70_15045, partial [Anaerolineae bacterium]|nr:hypothetical protein [Anaerolineae bacterium]
KEYHYNDAKPGKPLYLLIPGGLIALAAIGLIIYIAYQTWFNHELETSQGLPLILLLAPFYIGGVYLFSYGYELYDQKKALRLTAIIVFITVSFVVIIAVLFALAKGGSSSSKSSSSSSESSSSSSSGAGHSAAPAVSTTTRSGGSIIDPIFFVGGGGTHTVTETREVIKEVPMAPKPINCPSCGRSYVPAENKFACPNCGTATPQDLIDQSQTPSA